MALNKPFSFNAELNFIKCQELLSESLDINILKDWGILNNLLLSWNILEVKILNLCGH